MNRQQKPTPMKGKAYHGAGHSGSTSSTFKLLIGSLCGLACVGIFLTASLVPHETGGPSTNSVLSTAETKLSEKILQWVPSHEVENIQRQLDNEQNEKTPDWSKTFWTPTDIEVMEDDPTVTLCKLDFKSYSENPHSSPMFKDLQGASNCMGSNRKREKLSVLLDDIKKNEGKPEGRVVKPTGFVFHESRVGSTLVANLLASDPFAMVFSESTPIANAILHCADCSEEKNVQLFRDVLTLMGRSPIHNKMFVKFQSITTTKIQIALKAFPDTPWAFVFRNSVQTMMSHLDPKKGGTSAPCLRSKRNPPPAVAKSMVGRDRSANEAWCASHLKMLCGNALEAYENFGVYQDGSQRGMLINYESLPGIVPKALLQLFRVTLDKRWLDKMQVESKHYSKSRSTGFRLFFGDSKDKEKRSTPAIQRYAEEILDPAFIKLDEYAHQAISKLEAPMTKEFLKHSDAAWSTLKELADVDLRAAYKTSSRSSGGMRTSDYKVPSASSSSSAGASGPLTAAVNRIIAPSESQDWDGDHIHSTVLEKKEFVPWAPFANHHSSRPYEIVECPFQPAADYPKTYNMLEILDNWNTDNTEIPQFHYDSICHFDYRNETHIQMAYNYRDKEVPFILYNIPEVDEVVKKWNNVDYLNKLLGKKKFRTETSKSNHFMYWRGSGGKNLRGKWEPPTSSVQTTYEDWLKLAVKGQNVSLEEREHQYFRVSSDSSNEFLYNELPFFKPKKSLFLKDPREQRGIHCRFGMRSVIAEAHWDGSRNVVVEIAGLRRWIMTHPDQCATMHMYQNGHPSARHSMVDWSKPDVEKYPNFKKVRGNEVILQPGDFLFVPTYWIHYIVSLNVNIQCNTRSGVYHGYDKFLRECGF